MCSQVMFLIHGCRGQPRSVVKVDKNERSTEEHKIPNETKEQQDKNGNKRSIASISRIISQHTDVYGHTVRYRLR